MYSKLQVKVKNNLDILTFGKGWHGRHVKSYQGRYVKAWQGCHLCEGFVIKVVNTLVNYIAPENSYILLTSPPVS